MQIFFQPFLYGIYPANSWVIYIVFMCWFFAQYKPLENWLNKCQTFWEVIVRSRVYYSQSSHLKFYSQHIHPSKSYKKEKEMPVRFPRCIKKYPNDAQQIPVAIGGKFLLLWPVTGFTYWTVYILQQTMVCLSIYYYPNGHKYLYSLPT